LETTVVSDTSLKTCVITLEEKKKWEVKNELQVTNFELGISIPAVPDGGGKSSNREIS
jgi:hypothetical protein